ncbi:MAG: prepilin-type N-terminal cleavage/methylation domain-containing protein [Planctomycetes bacterium]|jgi:prepilin-type N-terminal cleavage/methylation domain-containing protein|nr:prepilin-type N-terminal cleavage/methylation domain-containing protein [Planctomycetota bacterium]
MGNNKTTIRAFTLVEMLTTVAIIGILLAVLIPAFNQVSKTATRVKQRAQFQNIEIALETFRSDTGDYPPSHFDTSIGQYSAAERLAEAVVGRDGFGFHPASRFYESGKGDIDGDGTPDPVGQGTIYNAIDGVICSSGYVQTAEENRAVRKGPYLELENANAVRLSNYGAIYQSLWQKQNKPPSLVLADVFKTAKLTTDRKTGRPILYYRANRLKTGHSADTIGANTYAYAEGNVIATLTGQSIEAGWFYNRTRNPNFTDPPRPYRAESFILHSAGPDGVYGTTDDMFNFDERE